MGHQSHFASLTHDAAKNAHAIASTAGQQSLLSLRYTSFPGHSKDTSSPGLLYHETELLVFRLFSKRGIVYSGDLI
jgi:hypothetical protein